MTKVTSDYPPEIARQKLTSLFNDSLSMIACISGMCDSQATVFAALCDGKNVTNAGNHIEADYEVTKLAAIINVLENHFYLPISRQKINTEADTGATALQARYMISAEDLSELIENPELVISRREKQAFLRLIRRDERCLKRLINMHGYDEVFKSLSSLQPANDPLERNCG